jgi:hypothetical protein
MKNTLTVRFKKYDNSEFYSYNPETGILYILVNLEHYKGYLVKTGQGSGDLMRIYHKEIYDRLPEEHRVYESCSNREYADVWSTVLDYTNNAFRATISETF